ncbi:MAG: DUF285 domain-containing protein [Clostridia bacterium]|nr:DUF285 domain-containing protein [Clostridia bacterium]
MVSTTSYYTNNCIKEAVVAKGCNPESYHMLFAYLPGLTTVRFECDTANDEIKNPKSIRSMFVGSSNIETIEFPSGVSFKDLEDASYAFSKCSKLNTVIFNNTTNAKLSSCVSMFDSSSKLSTITGIEDFDVSEVEEFTKMFQKCNALTNLDLSNWDVSNAKNFDYMFYQCSELTSLNIDE